MSQLNARKPASDSVPQVTDWAISPGVPSVMGVQLNGKVRGEDVILTVIKLEVVREGSVRAYTNDARSYDLA